MNELIQIEEQLHLISMTQDQIEATIIECDRIANHAYEMATLTRDDDWVRVLNEADEISKRLKARSVEHTQ